METKNTYLIPDVTIINISVEESVLLVSPGSQEGTGDHNNEP